jgi:aspartate/tyrosine/aromatic aminotransferase
VKLLGCLLETEDWGGNIPQNKLIVNWSIKLLLLAGERVGCLTVVLGTGRAQDAINISSQLILIARAMYICPPKYGAEIVSTVLSDPALMDEW